MQGGFLELAGRAIAVGLFPGLIEALGVGGLVRPYTVPRGDMRTPYNKRAASAGDAVPVVKKRKLSQGSPYALDKNGASTPGSSPACSQQPRGVNEGIGSEPSTPRNPFSRPPSAGPVSLPCFAKAALSTATGQAKAENANTKEEQDQPGQQAVGQDLEPEATAKGVGEYSPKLEGGQIGKEVAQQPQAQAQAQPEPQPTKHATSEKQGLKVAYDDLLSRIENEVFHAGLNETPEEQLKRVPAAIAMIETTAGTILKSFQAVERACAVEKRRDLFMASLTDTVFALLWILESCALDRGSKPLAGEVSRSVNRRSLVGALWGSVRLATAKERLDLVSHAMPPLPFPTPFSFFIFDFPHDIEHDSFEG
jgi:hypothetical protein